MSVDLLAVVGDVWGVNREMLLSRRRHQNITDARQVAMALLWESNLTNEEVGEIVGRCHTTVSYAVGQVAAKYATDPQFRKRVDKVRAILATEQNHKTTRKYERR